jgi:uncharacterized NAD(P)/FAD-binding protein YdhS
LLLGTGLSMLDVAMLLEGPAHQGVQIDAISRRGLLPQAHRDHIPSALFATHDALIPPALRALAHAEQQQSTTTLSILRIVRAAIRAHAPGDWRDVIAAIRPITPALWRALPEAEQQRFTRHLAPYWDTRRHRAAPAPARMLAHAITSGRIKVKAARIVALEACDEQLLVSTKARGSAAVAQQKYDVVINCTGPQNSLLQLQDTLIDAIIKRGLAKKLHNGAGFAVAQDLSLAIASLHYVGPLLRANFLEATAVPELREHARTVAAALTR